MVRYTERISIAMDAACKGVSATPYMAADPALLEIIRQGPPPS